MGSVSQPIIAATEQLGVYAPLLRGLFYLTLFTQFTGSPRRLSLMKPDETPLNRLAASDRQLRILETKLAAIRQVIDSFCDGGLEPPNS